MRLTHHQAQTIKTQAEQVFGLGAKGYLFGSRVDNHLKGGDIDLYVVPPIRPIIWSKACSYLLEQHWLR